MKSFLFELIKLYMPNLPFFYEESKILIASWKHLPRFFIIPCVFTIPITIIYVSSRVSLFICPVCNEKVCSIRITKHRTIPRSVSKSIASLLQSKLIAIRQWKYKWFSRIISPSIVIVLSFPCTCRKSSN